MGERAAGPGPDGLTVLSLNYHEVTADARVLKQARALAARGHRVAVACRHLDGHGKHETVDGVTIHRFACYSHEHVGETDLLLFSFLDRSRPLVEARYLPYAREAAKLRGAEWALDWAERQFRRVQDAAPTTAAAAVPPSDAEGVPDLLGRERLFGRTTRVLSFGLKQLRSRRQELWARIEADAGLGLDTREDRAQSQAIAAQLRTWKGLRNRMNRLRQELRASLDEVKAGDAAAYEALARRHREAEVEARAPQSARDARAWLRVERSRQARVVSALFHELYQAASLVFAVNLLREELPVVPDIIHAHDFYTLPGAILLARRHGAKVLYDAHEYEPGRATKMPPEGAALIDAMERDCLAHVDRMTTVSQSIAELYADRFAGPRPDLIMNTPPIDPDGVASDPQEAGRGRLRAMTDLGPEARVVVFTGGTQRENRGLDKVCLALAELPDHHLVVLGPRHAADDAWLRERARAAGVDGRVHLLPPVAPSQIVSAIADADLAISVIQDAGISYRYAMPNKLFEATFAHVPIVVSDLPEMRRFVEAWGNGRWTDQTDPAEIARAVRDVTANRGRYVMAPEAIEALARNYGWRVQEDRLDRIVRALGGDGRPDDPAADRDRPSAGRVRDAAAV